MEWTSYNITTLIISSIMALSTFAAVVIALYKSIPRREKIEGEMRILNG